MKYIGITGKRGSGRQTFAWLLAMTAQTIRFRDITFEKYQELFGGWVTRVKDSKDCISSTNYYILESFGQIILDSIKFTIPTLRYLDLSQGSPDLERHINPATLDLSESAEFPTVNDYVLHFADDVIKKNMGEGFWTAIAEQYANEKENDEYTTEELTLYWDVKTDTEIDFIARKGGTMISITCPERLREGGYNSIKKGKFDYTVRLHKDFVGDCEVIWNLAHELFSSSES